MRHFMLIVERAENPLTDPEFKAWFQGSLVVDQSGKPLVVYRGEHGDNQDGSEFHTKLGSISFGDRETASLYAVDPNDDDDVPHSPRVYPCYLRITKPVINTPDDPFVEVSVLRAALGEEKTARIVERFADAFEHTGNWYETLSKRYDTIQDAYRAGEDIYCMAYCLLDDHEVVGWMKAAGFDGAIHAGTGENAGETEFKIFDASQARSAISHK